jgi:predicted small integral membrane protein
VIKSRRIKWTGHVAGLGEMRNAYEILVGKPDGRRPLDRLRHKREDNIETDLKEIDYEVMNWIHLAQDRDQWWALVNTVINLQVP